MPEEIVFITLVAIFAGFLLAWIAIRHSAAVVRCWMETSLKKSMVARGYAAQEIIAVVGANRRGAGPGPFCVVPPAKPIRQGAYA
jgi:hypothetical protein